jgi:hypothetical protein
MAELLARIWSLGVLRVELDVEPEIPQVHCSLVITRDGERVTVDDVRFTMSEFGAFGSAAKSRARELDVGVPQGLFDEVNRWCEGGRTELPILWLNLRKPYGQLGAVPWEKLEVGTEIPVLRLPDVLPDIAPPTGSIDVAICAGWPEDGYTSSSGTNTLRSVIEAIRDVGRPVRFHIFSNQGAHHAIGEDEPDVRVESYEPALLTHDRPRTQRTARSGPVNPWLMWMLSSLEARGFDFVHFIGHGYLSGDRGALALPGTPTDNTSIIQIEARQLLEFLPRVGAYGAAFTALEQNRSKTGLRLLADALGSRRAGPVLMTDASRNVVAETTTGYRLMLGDADIGEFPETESLLLYVQPEVLLTRETGDIASDTGLGFLFSEAATERSASLAHSETVDSFKRATTAEGTPGWASVISRFVEQKEADLASASRGAPEGAQEAYARGANDALSKISEIAKRHLESS